MTKKIKTYEDLLQEEQRLTAQLASYKELIKGDIAACCRRTIGDAASIDTNGLTGTKDQGFGHNAGQLDLRRGTSCHRTRIGKAGSSVKRSIC